MPRFRFSLVLDFDSTLVQVETLPLLAKLVLSNNPHKEEVLSTLQEISAACHRGELSITVFLKKFLELTSPITKEHLTAFASSLRPLITKSFLENQKFLHDYRDQIYVVSANFSDVMVPVCTNLGLLEKHVYGNIVVFDETATVIGFDEDNVLLYENGKRQLIELLKLEHPIVVLGDGRTDLEIKSKGVADIFCAFTENVRRELIVSKADYECTTFDEFLSLAQKTSWFRNLNN